MKLLYRLISLTLAILLLTLCVSAAEEPLDFKALAEKGNVDTHVGLTVTCPPRHRMYWCTGTEDYVLFHREDDRRYCVADYTGNITFTLDPDCVEAALTEGNFVVANGRVYDVTGKQLSDERYYVQPDYNVMRTGIGDDYVLIANYVNDRTGGRQRFLLVDHAGRNLVTDGFAGIYQGIAVCCKDGKWGAQEFFGRTYLPFTYDHLAMANDGILVCSKDGKFGLIDLEGNTVVPFDYDEMTVLKNDDNRRIAVRKENLWGVIDLTGRVRVPIEYGVISGTDSPQIGGTPTQWYHAEKPGEVAWYNVCEDDTFLLNGSPAFPAKDLILTDGRFLQKAKSGETYALVDDHGERLIGEDIYYYDLFDGGYYFVSYDQTTMKNIGRLYSEDLELMREIPGATSAVIGFKAYVRFAKTESVLLVQCRDNDRVEVFGYDGTPLETMNATYLMGASAKTILLKKSGQLAVGTADAKHFTPFQYASAGIVDGEEEKSELVLVNRGSYDHLIHNTGTEMFKYETFGFERINGADKGYYMFRVPDGKCGFVQIAPPEMCFGDASDTDWFAKSISFCVNAGLMHGMGKGLFAPQTAMTRAMLVQVLYNLSGEPSEPHGFADVADGAWYADAVNWAAANGIVNGVTNERFDPNSPVTREQMVTILRRYAQRFGDAEGDSDALMGFSDRSRVSNYAVDSMNWAVTTGLINGRTPTTLEPQGMAKRAEVATVLMRFIKLMAGE